MKKLKFYFNENRKLNGDIFLPVLCYITKDLSVTQRSEFGVLYRDYPSIHLNS